MLFLTVSISMILTAVSNIEWKRVMNVCFYIILFALFFSTNTLYGMSSIVLNSNTQSIQLNHQNLEIGVTDNGNTPPLNFTTLPRYFITTADTSKYYWARIKIVNQSPSDKEWYLTSYNFNISSLDYFLESKSGLLQSHHYSYPGSKLSDNSVIYHSPTFQLLLPKQDTCVLYLKLKHTSLAQFGFEISEHGYFFNSKIINYLVLGLFYGALLILAFYHIMFYFQLKESFYLWYAVFIIFQVLYLSMRDGVALTLFFSNQPALFNDSYRWVILGLSTSTLLYAQHFLGLQKNKWTILTILLFVLIRIPLNLFIQEYNVTLMLADLSCTLIALVFCIYGFPQKRKETFIFVLSLLLITTGYLINTLWHADVIDNTEFIYESLYYTVFVEALLFSLANSYRLRRLQQQEEENIRKGFLLEIKNDLIQQQNSIIQERTESLETFLYKASHDLKGPLKSIDGLCDLGKKEKEEAPIYFDLILNSSKRLQGILESLLGLAKQRSKALKISSIPLAELIDNCIQQGLKELPGISTIDIRNQVPKEVIVKSDYFSLHSVVQNIIENAIKYQDEKKDIRYLNITYDTSELKHQLSFQDNGVGIPTKSVDRIFEMFYRANTSNSNGVGLGMYIVKQTIELLKGQISIESKENQYTNVKVELPFNSMLKG